jgi:hypothetical protein
MYFNRPGNENTAETVEKAVKEAKTRHISHIVVASNTGATTFSIVDEARKQSYEGKIINVTHVYGFRENGKIEMSDSDREKLEKLGVRICTAAHALSGAERGLSRKFQGIYPLEIIANTLRMFSQGVKVCIEIAVMSLDAGLIPFGGEIISVGGTGRGADTAVIITPSYSAAIMETKIHEILCMPR